jgi:hypothetical protein
VRRSDGSAVALGALMLCLGFPGMCESQGLLLRRLLVELSFQAHDDEDKQNNDADDAEGSVQCSPLPSSEVRL